MSIFDNLFGKKPLPYEPDHAGPEHKSCENTNPTGEKPTSVNQQSNMPPLVTNKTAEVNPKTLDNVPTIPTPTANDAEDTPFADWEKEMERLNPNGDKPKPGTIKPDNSTWPNTEFIPPGKSNSPKAKRYGSDFGPKPYIFPPIVPKIPEKEVFAFIVENSEATFGRRENIINIISQIVERKKDAIFLFVRVGNNQKTFLPMDYSCVKTKNVIDSLVTESETDELPSLASALFYLSNNLNVFANDTFSFNMTKYKLSSCSIVCVGTGSYSFAEDSHRIVASCITKLQSISKLKTFKYFCIKDSDAIRVASLGFPVIGHIISDFYE